ncbi:MAG: hypothetical protein OXI41_13495 [Chloroflexota bacterium]|nr:hypothetical protein [Chloroflexota bacterium]MDE2894921.1 hypothetical protein [Chloroflexota bacterium]
MVAETQDESPVPESAYADYEQDLLDEDISPAQARASRSALERIVDRLSLTLASKADLRDLRSELRNEMFEIRKELRQEIARNTELITQLHQEVAVLKAEMKLLKWMFALGGSAAIGLMSAMLVVLLTRL